MYLVGLLYCLVSAELTVSICCDTQYTRCHTVFTYRYFLERFPQLCILAYPKDDPAKPIGCVVGKVDLEENTNQETGYIGMLAVMATHRRKGIGAALVKLVLRRMRDDLLCGSVTLETEVSNTAAQRLYQETFGFIREELLVRYYLNWGDAYRLRLWFPAGSGSGSSGAIEQKAVNI